METILSQVSIIYKYILDYISKKDELLAKKLRMLKMRDTNSLETLKAIAKTSNEAKQFEWNKIPSNVNYDSLLVLEKLEFIFTKDHSNFVFLLCFDRLKRILDGDFADQTPILTGILMGTHKLSVFILAACFIIEHAKFGKNFFKKTFWQFRIIIEIQLNILMIIYIFNVYKELEEFYFNIFLWMGTKCVSLLIVDLFSIQIYLINRVEIYKKIETEEKSELNDAIKLI